MDGQRKRIAQNILITAVLRSRVVTLVLKIYFTIIMYPDCSSTQICLIHATSVFLELTQLDV
jgi:hypothetical protein